MFFENNLAVATISHCIEIEPRLDIEYKYGVLDEVNDNTVEEELSLQYFGIEYGFILAPEQYYADWFGVRTQDGILPEIGNDQRFNFL